MKRFELKQPKLLLLLSFLLLGPGCTTTLVHDGIRSSAAAGEYCSGSDWISDSSVAVVPVPIVAFFMPHIDTHEIRPNDYLNSCGDARHLVYRHVAVDRTACIPASLTRFVTLGIWQWCPARVSWEAGLVHHY